MALSSTWVIANRGLVSHPWAYVCAYDGTDRDQQQTPSGAAAAAAPAVVAAATAPPTAPSSASSPTMDESVGVGKRQPRVNPKFAESKVCLCASKPCCLSSRRQMEPAR